MSPTVFATAVSTGIGTIPLTPPAGLVAGVAAASLGAYIPQGGAITGVVPDLTINPGEVTLTVTGFFNFQVYYFFTDTITFTATIPVTIAPSGDASQPSRILSVTTGTITLSIFTTGPSPTLALLGLIRSLRGPVAEALIQSQIGAALESVINGKIDSLVTSVMASKGWLRSPTGVVSARNVVITSSGVRLELVLADLFGPAFSPIPTGGLHAQVSPAPQAGGQRLYTVTVTNTATGMPVNQANVTLLNYTTGGIAQLEGPRQTNVSGNPQPPFNVALAPMVTSQVDPITRKRTKIFHPPILTVSKTGFSTINLRLLEDPDDF
jgi:hypothetical protein